MLFRCYNTYIYIYIVVWLSSSRYNKFRSRPIYFNDQFFGFIITDVTDEKKLIDKKYVSKRSPQTKESFN